jgi:hypothetical protein
MCLAPSAPKSPPPPEPLKNVSQSMQQADTELRRRQAIAKGLASTWVRSSGNGQATPGFKAPNLAG